LLLLRVLFIEGIDLHTRKRFFSVQLMRVGSSQSKQEQGVIMRGWR